MESIVNVIAVAASTASLILGILTIVKKPYHKKSNEEPFDSENFVNAYLKHSKRKALRRVKRKHEVKDFYKAQKKNNRSNNQSISMEITNTNKKTNANI